MAVLLIFCVSSSKRSGGTGTSSSFPAPFSCSDFHRGVPISQLLPELELVLEFSRWTDITQKLDKKVKKSQESFLLFFPFFNRLKKKIMISQIQWFIPFTFACLSSFTFAINTYALIMNVSNNVICDAKQCNVNVMLTNEHVKSGIM